MDGITCQILLEPGSMTSVQAIIGQVEISTTQEIAMEQAYIEASLLYRFKEFCTS